MLKGVKIEDVRLGSGKVAIRGAVVRINYDLSLNQGEHVQRLTDYQIDLRRRDALAGLRYGIEGMREGGVRRLRVSPHLGYGEVGIPGLIPENAVLILEVELLVVIASEASAG
jgi:FKBP-type peptidyl-prolyl cis-trans isomerase